jgi:hypothetical protein
VNDRLKLYHFDPTGKSLRCSATRESSPLSKNISVFAYPKSEIYPSHPVPLRGAYHDRHGRWDGMRWTRRRWRAGEIAGRSIRERSSGAQDERRLARRSLLAKTGGCVRQKRVVLAPVAGVKSAEVFSGPTGFGKPSIRRRRWQDEFVAGESAL